MGQTEAITEPDTRPIDPELDPKRRAAEVDGTGAVAKDGGGHQTARRDEDEALAEIEAKHGVGGRKAAGGRKGARASEPREKPLSNKPLTWTAKDKANGDPLKREQEHKPERRRDQKGRLLAGEHGAEREIVEDEPEEPLEDDDAQEPEEDQPRDPKRASELETARRALRRDGWSDDDLDDLDEKAILRIGAHRARNQADIDAKFRDRNRDRQQAPDTATRSDSAASPGSAEDNRTDNGEVEVPRELEDALVDALVDQDLGKRTAKALAQTITQIVAKHKPADTGPHALLVNELMSERAKARIGERFPEVLTSSKLWNEVEAEAEVMYEVGVKKGRYAAGIAGADQAHEDAARVILGDPDRNASRRNGRRAAHAARENGSPTPPTSHREAGPLANVKSRDELEDLWLEARETGDAETMREISRLYESPRFRAFK